ncbi:TctA subunit of the tripartite Tricarboxylate transport(TTT) family protein [Paracoccus pantotrophus]|uniref:tripartite tricarboxylate transporter permease n=1 Tax=Paracoccus pantotrophus TaxID=82367 RepID=UPI000E092877|nr:tripartite tricarboxylate transporter permease [Paracoccus pantotrophus]RDD93558.1 TctA subunit of the tripartite Tricarboxylate transport(TTT) family protein [Paracoccus pantotrophus]WGR66688.1 TctA subunit of the tripartite Tricarboxylate transport(TTT) family protein [Paracoccus pantotrophus]
MFETWNLLAQGLANAASPTLVAAVCFGALIGLFIGALPGLGPTAGVAILLPVAVSFDGTAAIAALGAVYYGAQYGGAVTAILLGIPGDASATMTAIDGYQLAKKGKAGAALSMSVAASFIGGLIGLVLLTIFATTIASVAIAFGPVEMTALMVFSLALVSVLGGLDPVKSFTALFFGVWIGTIGLDPILGIPRYTFGDVRLFEGIDFSILAVGIFGLAEMFSSPTASDSDAKRMAKFRFRDLLPDFGEMWRCRSPLLSGSLIGFFVGILPGAGATASTMISYAVAKRMSKTPEVYGHGSVEGVASPEAANNSASYGNMIPMFALGIPGSGTTAVLMGGLLMIGLQPGPMLFATQQDFVWTIFGSFYIGNLALVVITLAMIPLLASCALVRPGYLYPAVIGIVVFGVYSINYSMFDVALTIGFGLLGYILAKLRYPLVPLVLGMILGPLLERGVRRSLVSSSGDLTEFARSPIAVALFIATALLLILPLILKKRRTAAALLIEGAEEENRVS